MVKDIGNSGLEMTIGRDNNSQEVEEGKDGKDDSKVDGNTEDIGKNIYFHEREHVRAGRNLGFTKNKCASVVVSSARSVYQVSRFAWRLPAFLNRKVSYMHEANKDVAIVLTL